MDRLDEVDVGTSVFLRGDVVGRVVVVRADVDEDDVRGGVSREIPRLWIVAVDFNGATGGIACLVPLVGLGVKMLVSWVAHVWNSRNQGRGSST